MSAASMPGQSTFMDMCEDVKNRISFYSVINTKDKDLNNFAKRIFTKANTDLGLNKNQDAFLIKQKYFSVNGHFEESPDLEQKQHSIFEYMTNNTWKEFLAKFLKE